MATISRYRVALTLAFLLTLMVVPAHAGMSTDALTDAVMQKFQSSVQAWQPVIQAAAFSVFWKLALVSLVISIGFLLASGQAELGSLVAGLIRYVFFTGFWSWILSNGPAFFQDIVRSLWQLGSRASGASQGLAVSQILDLALKIYHMDAGQTSLLNMGYSFLACAMGIVVVVLGSILASTIMMVLCSAWVVAYGGSIVLALGALPEGRDLCIAYLRSALAIGLRLMTLSLILGLGLDFLNQVIAAQSDHPTIGDLALSAMAMGILTILAVFLPGQVAALATGGGHTGVGAMGIGAAWAAARSAGQMASAGASAAGRAPRKPNATIEAVRQGERLAETLGNNRNGGAI